MKLQKLLETNNMTAEELSQKTGIIYEKLLGFMNNDISLELGELEKITAVFNVDWWELIEK